MSVALLAARVATSSGILSISARISRTGAIALLRTASSLLSARSTLALSISSNV